MKDKKFYYKKDRLNQLRGFCAVVQKGSLIKAAEFIGVEPTAVSKQIKALEDGLSLQLFERDPKRRNLKLTKIGEDFYKSAVSALQNLDGLFNYFYKDKEAEKISEIRLAMHHTAINYLLPKYIQEFRKIDKDTKFFVYNLKTAEALKKIETEEIDLLLTVVEEVPTEFDSKLITILKSCILVNKKNELATKDSDKITFNDLSKQNMITIDKSLIIPFFVSVCHEYKIKGDLEFVNGDWEMVRNFVKLNLGIHLYSEAYNKFEEFKDDNLILKNVDHLFPKMKFQLITKKGKIFNKNMKNFIKIVKDKTPNSD